MSSWTVRQAQVEDKAWVVKQTADFINYTDIGIPVDEAHLDTMFDQWMANPACYLLVADDGGIRKGLAAALLQPHFLNPTISIFTEMMWWVPACHRNSRAGLLLLNALDVIGSRKANLVAIATEHHSPLNPHTLEKRGFQPQELTYLKRTQCPPQLH